MSKNKKKTAKHGSRANTRPIKAPYTINYYVELFDYVASIFQDIIRNPEDISNAVMKSSCKDYNKLKASIGFCCELIEKLDSSTVEDFSITTSPFLD